jgi:hypothetical protein
MTLGGEEPAAFSRVNTFRYPWNRRLVGSRAGIDVLEKR